VDLLYHIAGKIKTVRDISFDKEKDENGNEVSPAKSKSKSKTPSPAEDEISIDSELTIRTSMP
jgi:hypothetical protein